MPHLVGIQRRDSWLRFSNLYDGLLSVLELVMLIRGYNRKSHWAAILNNAIIWAIGLLVADVIG